MELWQIDVMGGVRLTDGTGLSVVTGIDDHSRFCVNHNPLESSGCQIQIRNIWLDHPSSHPGTGCLQRLKLDLAAR
jgi:hypothetical protein